MASTWWVGEDQLDESQKLVIDQDLDASTLVLGPPGSGKTNLLLLRAVYLGLAGLPNLVLVVYTRSLREFLVQGAAQYNLPADRILTYRSWQYSFLQEFGTPMSIEGMPYDTQREALNEAVAEIIEEHDLHAHYDAILLDEAQDYTTEEIDRFWKLTPRLVAAADSKQRIYQNDDPISYLQSIVDSSITLKHHYRNGTKICRVADAILGIDDDEKLIIGCNYNEKAEPSSVEWFECDSIGDQIDTIVKKLDSQLKAYPNELICIACPRRAEVDAVWSRLSSDPVLSQIAILQKGEEHSSFKPDTRICVCTAHAAKGLEARVVHLVSAEMFRKFKGQQKRLAFTAITRAKTSLCVYHDGSMPGYLEGAKASLQPRTRPKLGDVFGGSDQ